MEVYTIATVKKFFIVSLWNSN